jgi:hypothetical protein
LAFENIKLMLISQIELIEQTLAAKETFHIGQ